MGGVWVSELAELEERKRELSGEWEQLQREAAGRGQALRDTLAGELAAFQQLERDVAEAEAENRALQAELEQLRAEEKELHRFLESARAQLRALRGAGQRPSAPVLYESTLQVWGVVALMGGVIALLLYVMISSLLR